MSYKELKAEAASLDTRLYSIKKEMTACKLQAERDLPESIYDWIPTITKISKEKTYVHDIPAGTEILMFEGRLKNHKVIDDHIKLYGDLINPPQKKLSSQRYWRKYNLLIPQGGGVILLVPYASISDTEWDQLKAGNIPEHLLKFKSSS